MASKRPTKSDVRAETTGQKLNEARSPWWAHLLVVLGLLLANGALYHRTGTLGFLAVDDADYVQNNPYIENLEAANVKHVLTTAYAANYAPANLFSYALDVAIAGGKNPRAIHISNVMWHGFVVFTVYLLAFTIFADLFTAATAALLFMVHPAHVEVVAWISSRKDLVATGFAALSMTFYLLYRRQPKATGWRYWMSVLFFLLASAGKQSVVLLPAVMMIWDVLVEQRRRWTIIGDKIPFGLVTIFFGWMTWQAQPGTSQAHHAIVPAMTELTNLWLLSGFGNYVLYRPAPSEESWSQTMRICVIAAAVAIWFAPLLFQWARQPVRAAICYWVLIQMVPPALLNFIIPITDRYLFLPSVGACILFADLLASLRAGLGRTAAVGSAPATAAVLALAAGLAAAWSAKTWNYTNEWCDPRSVWYGAHFRTVSPQVFQYLGEVYHIAGDRVDAFVKSGTTLDVTNELPLAEAVLTDSSQLSRLQAEWIGKEPTRTNSAAYRDRLWDIAWDQYQQATAHRGTLSAPNLFLDRGRLLVGKGEYEKAVAEFQIALRFAQTSTYDITRQETVIYALRSIGTAYWHMHNYKEALSWFLKAQELQKKSRRVWVATLDQEIDRLKSLAAQP